MGIGKIGTTIGKEIIGWTRTGGKSLLATKPVKVNIKELKLATPIKADTFCRTQGSLSKKAGTVLNTKTGKVESIIVQDSCSSSVKNAKILEAVNKEGKTIGKVSFEPFCMNELYPLNDRAIYLEYLGTHGDYKGVGTELVREVVKASKEAGFNGRVRLNPCTGSIPSDFRFPGFGNKCQRTSAAIQYKKMGFKAFDEEVDKLLTKELASGGTGLEVRKSAYGEGLADKWTNSMYLPEDMIQKYLTNQPI